MKVIIASAVLALGSLTTSAAFASESCGVNRDRAATTKTTLVVSYNVSDCPALSDPAGAKARICLEEINSKSWACKSLHRTNAPTVGTNTGEMRFIGLKPKTKYRAIGFYAKKINSKIYWTMTNSVILRTKK